MTFHERQSRDFILSGFAQVLGTVRGQQFTRNLAEVMRKSLEQVVAAAVSLGADPVIVRMRFGLEYDRGRKHLELYVLSPDANVDRAWGAMFPAGHSIASKRAP